MLIDFTKLENIREDSEGWMARCPFCAFNGADKKGQHLRIYKKTKKFSCIIAPSDHEHNIGILNLVGYDGIVDIDIEYKIPNIQQIDIERTYDKKDLEKLVKNYDYWTKRNISEQVMEKTRGGIAVTSGQMENRWVIPIFNSNDDIIGFAGRALKEEMFIKWKLLGKKNLWVYGDAKEIIDKKEVILVESFGDWAALYNAGIYTGLVLWGLNISQTLLCSIISFSPRKIIISTNNDTKIHQAGQLAAEKIKNKMSLFFDEGVVKIALPDKKDFGDCTKLEIQNWYNKLKS